MCVPRTRSDRDHVGSAKRGRHAKGFRSEPPRRGSLRLSMKAILVALPASLRAAFRTRATLQLEVLALRHQPPSTSGNVRQPVPRSRIACCGRGCPGGGQAGGRSSCSSSRAPSSPGGSVASATCACRKSHRRQIPEGIHAVVSGTLNPNHLGSGPMRTVLGQSTACSISAIPGRLALGRREHRRFHRSGDHCKSLRGHHL